MTRDSLFSLGGQDPENSDHWVGNGGHFNPVNMSAEALLVYMLPECPTRLYSGPARKSTFVNATIQISVSDFVPTKQPSASVPPYLTAHQPPPAALMLGHPLPSPRLPVQTNSRRPRPSGAGAVLTTPARSTPRGWRGLGIRPDTRPIRSF